MAKNAQKSTWQRAYSICKLMHTFHDRIQQVMQRVNVKTKRCCRCLAICSIYRVCAGAPGCWLLKYPKCTLHHALWMYTKGPQPCSKCKLRNSLMAACAKPPCVATATALPFAILCAVLPELLDGWVMPQVARLCCAAREATWSVLKHLHQAWLEMMKITEHLNLASALVHFPGFHPTDELQIQLRSVRNWDPPHHTTLCRQATRFMCNSFNYYVGQGNDFSEWATVHDISADLSPMEIMQDMNSHLQECRDFRTLMEVLLAGNADFLYSPSEADSDIEAVIGPAHCRGPGLLIALRHKCLPVVLCVRYTQATYKRKNFTPFLASLMA